jgi:uncharacterized protein (TIGR00297 family)
LKSLFKSAGSQHFRRRYNFGIGGWQWAILLLTFFISSSVLTRIFKNKNTGSESYYAKGGQRDAGQVLGNGLMAAFFVLSRETMVDVNLAWVCFAAAIAAVNADTWATELGGLSSAKPRLITNLMVTVDKGISGGVSTFGTTAAFIGAALIGLEAALLSPSGSNWNLFLPIAFAGFIASLADSWLGASVQAMFYCPVDQKQTEKHPQHSCGASTVHVRGLKWLNNDWVNFLASASGLVVILPWMSITNGF